jgi:hypothetical protein
MSKFKEGDRLRVIGDSGMDHFPIGTEVKVVNVYSDSCRVMTRFRAMATLHNNDLESLESDPVAKPSHYNQGEIECIDAIKSATVNKGGIEAVCVANVIKYLWRFEAKGNPVQDLMKAQFYLKKLIDERS